MDIQTLTEFFKWCTILNVGLLAFWSVWFLFASDLVCCLQRPWFSASREAWDLVMYSFLGAFKIFVLVLNVVPWVALLIIG
ncbi:MAG: hypothetical protein QF463_08205 [Vicinamibacterales bacterium]|jgi:hypothetical protein|nr:hypothetical protein [Acidobacteriota bacterium]MDP6371317.1 hypothetical protein [Vicinamibacterales bacterium]MDP6609034.1 hypothetical protein [Vicinamibacterales bacterium]HAK56707.1 hypothetical protein [Acidobacteriota bacterium]|tara:strand:+ start:4587 stop:4829 length:243 start_codon:yes stop_codon:yes gene_type:complete